MRDTEIHAMTVFFWLHRCFEFLTVAHTIMVDSTVVSKPAAAVVQNMKFHTKSNRTEHSQWYRIGFVYFLHDDIRDCGVVRAAGCHLTYKSYVYQVQACQSDARHF